MADLAIPKSALIYNLIIAEPTLENRTVWLYNIFSVIYCLSPYRATVISLIVFSMLGILEVIIIGIVERGVWLYLLNKDLLSVSIYLASLRFILYRLYYYRYTAALKGLD
jgi:hypothetical protein